MALSPKGIETPEADGVLHCRGLRVVQRFYWLAARQARGHNSKPLLDQHAGPDLQTQ